MPLMIGENYKLEATKLNIVLYINTRATEKSIEKSDRMKAMLKARYGDKIKDESDNEDDKPQTGWRVLGYFSKIENAFNHLLNMEIEKSDLKDVQTVVDALKRATEDIKNSLCSLTKTSLDKSLEPDGTSDKVEE